MKKRTFIHGVFGNRCPVCWEGAVFGGVYQMNEACPKCGFKFVKEDGYFLGAMVISYFVAGFSAVPTLILLIFAAHWEVPMATFMSCLQILLINPPLFHFSRLAWLHMDREISQKAFEVDTRSNTPNHED